MFVNTMQRNKNKSFTDILISFKVTADKTIINEPYCGG